MNPTPLSAAAAPFTPSIAFKQRDDYMRATAITPTLPSARKKRCLTDVNENVDCERIQKLFENATEEISRIQDLYIDTVDSIAHYQRLYQDAMDTQTIAPENENKRNQNGRLKTDLATTKKLLLSNEERCAIADRLYGSKPKPETIHKLNSTKWATAADSANGGKLPVNVIDYLDAKIIKTSKAFFSFKRFISTQCPAEQLVAGVNRIQVRIPAEFGTETFLISKIELVRTCVDDDEIGNTLM
ncbi:hypothetical protein B484DRAFT_404310 [Ochromonadaceae sp. CCMP2298]|nr:hypothetical protein B484DRAFT_404310 [Ochromonadaceae sp. CCMP2298]